MGATYGSGESGIFVINHTKEILETKKLRKELGVVTDVYIEGTTIEDDDENLDLSLDDDW